MRAKYRLQDCEVGEDECGSCYLQYLCADSEEFAANVLDAAFPQYPPDLKIKKFMTACALFGHRKAAVTVFGQGVSNIVDQFKFVLGADDDLMRRVLGGDLEALRSAVRNLIRDEMFQTLAMTVPEDKPKN